MKNRQIDLIPGAKILLVQLRAMGDTLLTTPLIRSLHENYPDIEIDILVEPLPAQILRNNPHIRKIHNAPVRGANVADYHLLIRQLRAEHYTLAIDLLSTPGSALLTRLTGARFRIGYRLRGRSWAYTHSAERRTEPLYNPLTKFDLVKLLNLTPSGLQLEITLTPDDERQVDEIISKLGIQSDNRLFSLSPWSKRAWRRWKMEAWLSLMKKIEKDRNITWILFASEKERPELREIENSKNIDVRWAGTNDLIITAGLMRRTDFMLCADNGLKHIAVAMDVPSLTVFTGSDPIAWHPPEMGIHRYIESEPDPVDLDSVVAEAYREYEEIQQIIKGTTVDE